MTTAPPPFSRPWPASLANRSVLMVPGWGGSGPTHWQSRWERLHPEILRVTQENWDAPEVDAWVDRLASTVRVQSSPVVLIAHSLGCCVVLHAAARGLLDDVRGAFLVAMPDVTRPDFPTQIVGFAPLPQRPLPFPAVVVGSTDDPYTAAEVLASSAEALGARWVSVGPRHHIGEQSGVGDWAEGLALFDDFFTATQRG